jgi:hypothetical protein
MQADRRPFSLLLAGSGYGYGGPPSLCAKAAIFHHRIVKRNLLSLLRLGGYVKLAAEERRKAVEELAAEGESTREIGKVLGVDHVTVMNDLAGEKSPDKKKSAKQNQAPTEDGGENSPPTEDPPEEVTDLAGAFSGMAPK